LWPKLIRAKSAKTAVNMVNRIRAFLELKY
jgi:hypothetical protein